jgi:type VI secretion system protein ImpG
VRDDLLLFYERELNFIRQMGAEFAERYPKIASRLLLESDKCDDPHVERIIEAFAFIAARVHLKIEDEFPEFTESLLTIVYPHYVRTIPSMSVVELVLDPTPGRATVKSEVPRGTTLLSRPVGGDPCKFQTCYDTTLWPIEVTEAQYIPPDRLNPPIRAADAVGAFRLQIQSFKDVPLDRLAIDSLRFYLHGESKVVHTIYELILNNCVQIMVRDPLNTRRKPTILTPHSLRAVGFAEDEGMLPYPRRSLLAYRLLQEYFCLPEKFFFIDINDLQNAWHGFKDQAELIFLISPFEREDRKQELELGMNAKTFRLGCTPVINVFPQTCEPILLDQRKYEYLIVPDIRRINSTEIYSVEEVLHIDPVSRESKSFEPFYSYRHASFRDKKQAFWMVNRRASTRKDDQGTDLYLSMVDLSQSVVHPDVDTLTVRALCTNRDLPSRLPFGSENGDFTLELGVPVQKIVCLRRPTAPYRPPVGKAMLWRLISHLSINYLSLVEEGKDALQEILRLYNYTDSVYAAKQIDGIVSIRSSRQFARVISENGISFARGLRAEIEFDEEQFVGGGVFLFASVLEYFLGLYATLNSFSQLCARTKQRKGVLREWLPRAGQRILM